MVLGISLNIGSGERPTKTLNGHSCINVDMRDMSNHEKYKEADFIQCDVRTLPFEDNCFEVILASDIIEHFPANETTSILMEWARVLKPDGLLMFRTPDLEWMARRYLAEGDAKFISYHIFGGQNYDGNFHYVIFDKKWLEQLCNQVGLVLVNYKRNHSNFEMTVKKVKK